VELHRLIGCCGRRGADGNVWVCCTIEIETYEERRIYGLLRNNRLQSYVLTNDSLGMSLRVATDLSFSKANIRLGPQEGVLHVPDLKHATVE
jgi:hypothetical protein